MSDDQNLPTEADLRDVPPPEVLALAKDMVELEKAKVSAEFKAIEASDEQDKRRATFLAQRIRLEDEADQRRTKIVWRTMLGLFGLASTAGALVLWMAFWGEESQREIAISILATGGTGLGGFGVIYAVSKGIQSLLKRK